MLMTSPIRSMAAAAALLAFIGTAWAQDAAPKPFLPELGSAGALGPTVSAPAPASGPKPFFPALAAPASEPPKTEALTLPEADAERVHLVSAGPVVFATASATHKFLFSLASPAQATISIGYLTGPENHEGHSAVRILLNGTVISEEPLAAAAEGRVEVIVPERMTQPGLNRIEVRVTQSDESCGTGEQVWTQIRPEATYVDLPPGAPSPLWVSPGPDGYVDLTVVRAGGEDKASATSAITAAMRVSNTLSRSKVRTRVVSDISQATGADLIVSTGPVAAGTKHHGAPVVSVQQLAALPPDQIENIVEVKGGQTVTLREFGIVAAGWSESQYSETFFFRLPDDYLSRNHGRMRVVVSGSAEGRMDPRASMEVFINDEMSSGAPIPSDWGKDGTWSFKVPMQHARPGLNRMRIVMNTPMPDGGNCAVGSVDAPRFALFGDTSITFPAFAQARRLSISGLTESSAVSVVANPQDDYAISVAATLLTRTSRTVKALPEIEVAEMPGRLEGRNALVISTGGASEPTYGAHFGIDGDDISKWRDAMSQRMSDVLVLDEMKDTTETEAWALERYAYRNVDHEPTGRLSGLWRLFLERVGPAGVSLRGDDAAFAVARKTDGGGTHVLMAISDERVWDKVSDTISESVIFAWDARASHIEVDGDIRSYKDAGIPQLMDYSVSNLRLVLADIVSSTPFLYLLLILSSATLLGLSTKVSLHSNRK